MTQVLDSPADSRPGTCPVSRPVDGGARVTGSAAAEEPLDRAVAAMLAAARELGVAPRAATQGVRDADEAREVLQRLARALAASGPDVEAALYEVRVADAELAAGAVARQRSMLPVLNRAVAELRVATSVEELADAVPYQAVQLGYDRAMFSWVDDERWVPRSAHLADGPDVAAALVEAGGPPYVHVRDLLEVDVVRARRPLLALDVEGNPRVHQRLWAVTHSRSYVAAPVVARGRVAALVHLDRNLDTQTTDAFDRDLLAAFCQGVGLVLDHLFALGGEVGEVPRCLSDSWVTALTTREQEVLRLVAAGLTNSEIGRRLFVSDETVKTHLSRLMRKLGVSKRSQAAALYARLSEQDERGPAPA